MNLSIFPLTLNIIYKSNYSQQINHPNQPINDFNIKYINCQKQGNISKWQPSFLLDQSSSAFKKHGISDLRYIWEDYFLPFNLSDHSIINQLIGCLQMLFVNPADETIYKQNGIRTKKQINILIDVLQSAHNDIIQMLAHIMPGIDQTQNQQIHQNNLLKVSLLFNIKHIADALTDQQFPFFVAQDVATKSTVCKLAIIILMCARLNYHDIITNFNIFVIQSEAKYLNTVNNYMNLRDKHVLKLIIMLFMREQSSIAGQYFQKQNKHIMYDSLCISEQSINLIEHGNFRSTQQHLNNEVNTIDLFKIPNDIQYDIDEIYSLDNVDTPIARARQQQLETYIKGYKADYIRNVQADVSNILKDNQLLIQQIEPAYTFYQQNQYDDTMHHYCQLLDKIDRNATKQRTREQYNILRQMPYLQDDFLLSQFDDSPYAINYNLLVVNRKQLLSDYYIGQLKKRSTAYFFERSIYMYMQFHYVEITESGGHYQQEQNPDVCIYKEQIQQRFDYLRANSKYIKQISKHLGLHRKNIIKQRYHIINDTLTYDQLKQEFDTLVDNDAFGLIINIIYNKVGKTLQYGHNTNTISSLLNKYHINFDQNITNTGTNHIQLITKQTSSQTILNKQLKCSIDIIDKIILPKQVMFIKKQIQSDNVQTNTYIQSLSELILFHNIVTEYMFIYQDIQCLSNHNKLDGKRSQLIQFNQIHDYGFDIMFLLKHLQPIPFLEHPDILQSAFIDQIPNPDYMPAFLATLVDDPIKYPYLYDLNEQDYIDTGFRMLFKDFLNDEVKKWVQQLIAQTAPNLDVKKAILLEIINDNIKNCQTDYANNILKLTGKLTPSQKKQVEQEQIDFQKFISDDTSLLTAQQTIFDDYIQFVSSQPINIDISLEYSIITFSRLLTQLP